MARTAMIVDDIDFVRKTMAEILRSAHYQIVAEAKNGLEAVELYRQHQPNVVTMDVVMPELSGIDATRRIIKMDKDAKIVIVSALGQEHLVMEAINAGAKDYVIKPFSAPDILKTLNHVLADREKESARQALR